MKKKEAVKILEKLQEDMSTLPNDFEKDMEALEVALYTMKTTTARWWETVLGIIVTTAIFGGLALIACLVYGGI